MFIYNRFKTLEHNIREYLTYERQANPTYYRVKRFNLFTVCANALAELQGQTAPYMLEAGRFNKVLGDMKKVGMICSNGNQEVWISDDAWAEHCARKSGGQ